MELNSMYEVKNMKMAAYVLLMASVAILMYMAGNESILMGMLNNPSYAALLTTDGSADLAKMNLWVLGAAGILTVALGLAIASLTGFGSLYIVALILAFAFLNLVVFPIGSILDPSTPDIVKIPMILFFNILLFITIYSEGRGR